MRHQGYPFQYVCTDGTDADEYLKETLVYKFTSVKSNHEYEVRVEHYDMHLYCIKFFDVTTGQRTGKFSQVTGTFEPRTIFQTIANIAFDVCQRDKEASFFFIGAADKRDLSGVSTRRYRVYREFIRDLGVMNLFEPYFFDYCSLCILVNLEAVPDGDAYVRRIMNFVESIL